MGEAGLVLVILILIGFFFRHLLSLGSPYIEETWCSGKIRYYVWIKRFGGYADLAGSCDSKEEADRLLKRVQEHRT